MTSSSHLPPQPTAFVGRQDELDEFSTLLADPICRLLTLVGPGGIGKTRLALELARRQDGSFADGAIFVPLQAIPSPDLIVPTIADALCFCCFGDQDIQHRLLDYLRDKQLLLVLDNFEHLLDGAAIISDILAAAPGVKIVVTSRQALSLQEEWLRPIDGLEFPAEDGTRLASESVEHYGAVRLFVQSASRVRADFSLANDQAHVIEICRLVDGMPLAIELAAAWLKVLPSEDIARQIRHNLDFLVTHLRNVPERHRSIRAVFDHAWGLLTPEEQTVFKRLAVFRGGFELDAAEHVAAATWPVLAALVDKSLVRYDAGGRYDLHELLRQYVAELLNASADECSQTHDRHGVYYAEFLGQQWNDLQGDKPKEALVAIERELKNVRASWNWAVENRKEAEIDRALDSFWFFFDTRCRYQEGEEALERAAIALRMDHPEGLVLGRVLARQGVLCNSLDLPDKAKALLNESLLIARRHNTQVEVAFALARLGEVASFTHYLADASTFFQEALAVYQELGDRWGMAFVLNWLGRSFSSLGEHQTAYQHRQRSYALYQAIGSRWGMAVTLASLGYSAAAMNEFEDANRFAQESLALCEEIGIQWGIGMSLNILGEIVFSQGQNTEAEHYWKRALRIAIDFKLARFAADALYGIVRVMRATGEQRFYPDFMALLVHNLDQARIAWIRARLAKEVPEALAAAIGRSSAPDFEAEIETVLAEWFRLPERSGVETGSPSTASVTVDNPMDALTEREIQILRLVAEGMSNREIAAELILSLGTVKWYLNQIYGKLHVSNRTQAIARARTLKVAS